MPSNSVRSGIHGLGPLQRPKAQKYETRADFVAAVGADDPVCVAPFRTNDISLKVRVTVEFISLGTRLDERQDLRFGRSGALSACNPSLQ